MKKVFSIVSIFTTFFLYANEPIEYGWNIPNTPINIGGYLDVVYNDNGEKNFLLDDISLLFYDNHEHFEMLGEIEISHLSLDGKSNNSSDIAINLERLQLGYAFNDQHHITVGRFNSDIGYWNQAPVNILQETTTEPHMLKYVFPKATTGLMYQNHFNDDDSFSLTFQHNDDIGKEDDSVIVDRHIGMAYHKVINDFSWRVAGGFYKNIKETEAHYFGLGVQYDTDLVSLQSEIFTQHSNQGQDKPYSGYAQSVWHFLDRQDLVFRFEAYDDEELFTEEQIYLLGYVYRPLANIAIKGEYIHHTELPLNRFVASLSVMF